jgi:hypothetical protein
MNKLHISMKNYTKRLVYIIKKIEESLIYEIMDMLQNYLINLSLLVFWNIFKIS